MIKLCIATGNQGKVREMKEMLSDLNIEVLSLKDFENLKEVPETGTSFLENSCQKCEGYAKQTQTVCLADDSGLCVDALNGAPGIYSARFAKDDKEKCQKLLVLMEEKSDRKAHFNCFATLYFPQGVPEHILKSNLDFQPVSNNIICCIGVLEGEIARETKGKEGFGFDPVFLVKDTGKHLAEMTSEEKNAISHRGQAMRKIKKILELL